MKAIINTKSQVDVTGAFEVNYRLVEDDEVLFDNISIRVKNREDLVQAIKNKIADIEAAQEEQADLSEGEELDLG